MAGRNTKLTADVALRILNFIRSGAYKKHAANAAGVSVDAVDNWIRRGEQNDAVEPYESFAIDFRRAQAEDAIRDVQTISKASDKDWRAAAWKLERKYPREFGLKQQVEHIAAAGDGDGVGPVQVHVHLKPAESGDAKS